jgi:hypothetical protein
MEGISSIASDDADKGSSPETGADKDLMDALTYNASSLSVREIFEAIMKELIDAIKH